MEEPNLTQDVFRFPTFFLFWASANGSQSGKFWSFLIWVFIVSVQTLMGIKASLVDLHGVLDNWDGDLVDPCSWAMVTCSSKNLNLCGTLSLSKLSQNNNITGPIPPEFGRLSKVITLDLSNNFFTSEVPFSRGHLKSLRYMRTNNNSLSGTIPLPLANITRLALL
ncbi:Protein NSP-INTERACTING KINASE 1 [Camellia lanceoleosa]|uniref:Protein NSP-INTERACTING KINASE 1 n=1 Tax=Camellia lanceoleosa TaxID=1840588 RepID=A0ACC0FYE5_9ERIC|nr:Protein NSP-INTERACTING KINASE 1 [Camellia lanceoleosa]